MSDQAVNGTAVPQSAAPNSLFAVLCRSAERFGSKTACLYRRGQQEQQVSYQKLFDDVLLLATAFTQQGISGGDKVLLLSDNRYEWIVTDLAIMSLGAVSVPRGADTPEQELAYLIDHAECSYLVLENPEMLQTYADCLRDRPALRGIFVITGPAQHRLLGRVYAYQELLASHTYTEQDRQRFLQQGDKLQTSDLLTIIYTSGTTGTPKGVQLSHGNILHNLSVIPEIIALGEDETWLSILPTWHIFERTAEYAALSCGNTLIYSSVKTFAQDLEQYRPTLVATVPRVWESLYGRVQAAIKKKGAAAERIFQMLVRIAASYRAHDRQLRGQLPVFQRPGAWLWGGQILRAFLLRSLLTPAYLLARKKLAVVQQRFGGRLRLAISGGGTLAPYLEDWIDAVGIRIVNAYGMTECAPAIAGRGVACQVYGTLGPVVPGAELRITGAEGQLLPAGREGQIEVRGPQVTAGYYRNPEENAKAFTADGFFRTGDLGRLTITGELAITGRAKEIIVLASGENVDPTRIENTISMFPFVQDAVLVGQDKKGLAALVVPNLEGLREYVARKFVHLKQETSELLTNRHLLEALKNDINRQLVAKLGFKPHERLRGLALLEREFTLGEELTNTLKKKRHVIEQKYRQIINDLLH